MRSNKATVALTPDGSEDAAESEPGVADGVGPLLPVEVGGGLVVEVDEATVMDNFWPASQCPEKPQI